MLNVAVFCILILQSSESTVGTNTIHIAWGCSPVYDHPPVFFYSFQICLYFGIQGAKDLQGV